MNAKISSKVGEGAVITNNRAISTQQIQRISELLEEMIVSNKTEAPSKEISIHYVHRIDGSIGVDDLICLMEEFNKTKYYLNKYIGHNLMKILAYLDQINLSKKIFQYLRDYKVADEYTFSIIIDSLGKNGLLAEAEDKYLEAIRIKKCNNYVFSAIINVAGKNSCFELSKNAYEAAKKMKKLNEAVHVSMINSAIGNKEYILAEQIFNELMKKQKFNQYMFPPMISMAGKKRDPAFAEKVFNIAKSKGLINTDIYISIIEALGNCNKYEQAKLYFTQLAEKANQRAYSSIIKLASNFGKHLDMKQYFFAALSSNLCNADMLCDVLDSASNANYLDLAKDIFETVSNNEELQQDDLYGSIIKAANFLGDIELANKVYEQALDLEIANYNVFASMILVYGSQRDFNMSCSILERADKLNSNKLPVKISFINAMGKCNKPEEISKMFLKIKKSKTATAEVYEAVIGGWQACEGDHSRLITQAFDEAFLSGKWNVHSFDTLNKLGKKEKADSVSQKTIINHIIAHDHITKDKLLGEGAFGRVYSGTMQQEGLSMMEIATKEVNVNFTKTYIAQNKNLPHKILPTIWAEIYKKYVPKNKAEFAVNICLFVSSTKEWYICYMEHKFSQNMQKIICCKKSIKITDIYKKWIKSRKTYDEKSPQDLLIENHLNQEIFETISTTEFATVNQRADMKRQILSFCDLFLFGRKETEWRALREEVMLIMGLSHPNIVKFLGITLEKEPYGLIMQKYTGGDLRQYLERSSENYQSCSIEEKITRLRWAHELSKAIAYLHENKIIHGDVKSNNALLNNKNKLVLTDFGLSTIGYNSASARGTPNYMSPEVINGGFITPKSDAYSLGVVIWEIFQCELPWKGRDVNQLKQILSTNNPTGKVQHLPIPADNEWPKEICDLILGLWSVNVDERISVADARDKLNVILELYIKKSSTTDETNVQIKVENIDSMPIPSSDFGGFFSQPPSLSSPEGPGQQVIFSSIGPCSLFEETKTQCPTPK